MEDSVMSDWDEKYGTQAKIQQSRGQYVQKGCINKKLFEQFWE